MAAGSRADRQGEVLRRVEAGQSEREIARVLGISRTQVWSIKQASKKAATAAAK